MNSLDKSKSAMIKGNKFEIGRWIIRPGSGVDPGGSIFCLPMAAYAGWADEAVGRVAE